MTFWFHWKCSVTQSCLTLWLYGLCSLPDSSIHRISQARILEWLAISYSRSSSDPGSNCCHWCLYVSCFGRQNEFFTTEPPGKPSGFTSRVQEVASECESMHCVIYREMLASQKKKKSHLNLTTFCRMWLKLSVILKYMPLIHICSHSSVRQWIQSTHIFSYTWKWDGFLR